MNRTGRPTLDKKEQTIKLRLNDEMRAWIEKRSQAEGISMSEYIRGIIEADMMLKISRKCKKAPRATRRTL